MEKLNFSIGNIITMIMILCSLAGFYFMTQYRLDSLEAKVTDLKEEIDLIHPRKGMRRGRK